MPLILPIVRNPEAPEFGGYPLDLCRRIDLATGLRAATATVTAPAWNAYATPDQPIRGSNEFGGEWHRAAGLAADPDISWIWTVDLGDTLRVAGLLTRWVAGRNPLELRFDSSIDGLNWSELSPNRIHGETGTHDRSFPSTRARHVRLVGTGIGSSGLVHPAYVKIHLAWDMTQPITAEGLNVLYGCPTSQWTDETPGQWQAFGLSAAVQPTLGRGVTLIQGKVGSTTDASAVLDLGRPCLIAGIVLCPGNGGGGMNPGSWEFGYTLEGKLLAGDSWTTLADSSDPFDLATAPAILLPEAETYRYLRLVNPLGTYDVGHPSAGLTGTGTGAVGMVEIVGGPESDRILATGLGPDPRGWPVRLGPAGGHRRTCRPAHTRPVARRCGPDGARLLQRDGRSGGRVAPGRVHAPERPFRRDGPVAYHRRQLRMLRRPILAVRRGSDVLAIESPGGCHDPGWNPIRQRRISLRERRADDRHDDRRIENLVSEYGRRQSLSDGRCRRQHPLLGRLQSRGPAASTIQRRQMSDGGMSHEVAINVPATAQSNIRNSRPVVALAAERTGTLYGALFVANHAFDRIEIYGKVDLDFVRVESVVTSPTGLAAHPTPGILAVAHGGSKVSLFSYNTSTYVFNGTPIGEITGLADPGGLSIIDRAGTITLYVTEAGTGKIKQYDITTPATPVAGGTFHDFGQAYAPGPCADDRFAWQPMAAGGVVPSLAAVADGGLVVADIGNCRVVIFDAAGDRAGMLFRTHEPAPTIDPGTLVDLDTPVSVLFGSIEIQVYLNGQTFPDGLGDGTWRLHKNYLDTAGRWFIRENMSPTEVRYLEVAPGDVRRYLFQLCGAGGTYNPMTVWQDHGGVVKLSTIIGSGWYGADGTYTPAGWLWRDTDGTGAWGATDPVAGGANGKILEWLPIWEYFAISSGHVPDAGGNIYISQCINHHLGGRVGNPCKLPIAGFDVHGNPIYTLTSTVALLSMASLEGWSGDLHQARDIQPLPDGGYLLQTHPIAGDDWRKLIRRFNAANVEMANWSFVNQGSAPVDRIASIWGDPNYFVEAGANHRSWVILRRMADGQAVGIRMPSADGIPTNWPDCPLRSLWAGRIGGTIVVFHLCNYAGFLALTLFEDLDDSVTGSTLIDWEDPESWAEVGGRAILAHRLRLV